ncbi:hypothetical protein U1Q18_012256 [Sarracenia purpurea var. burkii]
MRRPRRICNSRRRVCRAHKRSKKVVNGGSEGGSSSSVSDKMEALKNLIPAHNGDRKADQLFQETADYIVLLETQVLILQRLIGFYGSNQNQNAVQ